MSFPTLESILALVSRIAGKIGWSSFELQDLQRLMKDRINHVGPLVEQLLRCELELAGAASDDEILVRCLPRNVVAYIESSPESRERIRQLVCGEYGTNPLGYVIPIDRSTPFDPVAFVGKQWKIKEQDERSLALSELDLTTVCLETMLVGSEHGFGILPGYRLDRLKRVGYVRLDAKIFETLWRHQRFIPEHWKGAAIGSIFFDGTILEDSDGYCTILRMWWSVGGWRWDACLDDRSRNAMDVSAVIKQLAA